MRGGRAGLAACAGVVGERDCLFVAACTVLRHVRGVLVKYVGWFEAALVHT